MRITELDTKDRQVLQLGKLTILVGPNNVGKSQTLRDIYNRMLQGPSATTIIIDRLTLERPPTFEALLAGIQVDRDPNNQTIERFQAIGPSLLNNEQLNMQRSYIEEQYRASADIAFTFGNISKFYVAFLDAASRLNVARASSSFNPSIQAPQNSLQAIFGPKANLEMSLQYAFAATFGMQIKLDYSGMIELVLRVAKEFPDIPEDPRKAYPIMSQYSRLDDQGDGFRSFVGVVLSLLVARERVVLLDEPEAFLHPAQARILGSWIAEHARDVPGQIVVSTHNANFLAGILTTGHDVHVYRLNRTDNHTAFTQISAEATSKLAKSPLLSSQRVLEAIFSKGAVVCEADADRCVYQTVASRELHNNNLLFLHSHNKQSSKDVVRLLRDAAIPVCSVVDIDILSTQAELEQLANACAPKADIGQLLELRRKVAKAVDVASEEDILGALQTQMQELLDQLARHEHQLSGARGALNRVAKEASKWSQVKEHGVAAFDEELRNTVEQLLAEARSLGLFIVPVGELEGWLELGTSHKNKWIVKALDALYQGGCTEPLRSFVADILRYLGEPISDRPVGPSAVQEIPLQA